MPITRRSLLQSAAAAPALLLGQRSQRKNVLFVASDDMNNAIGCYGHPVVKTPHLDALAARGTRFDRAYCQFPLCGPSRTSLLSGMRPDSTRIWRNEIAVRETMPGVVTLPQMFRQNGYFSARYGKMYHMGVPTTVGTNKYDDPQSWDEAVSPSGQENKTAGKGRNVTPSIAAGGAFHWIAFDGDGKDQADEGAATRAVDLIDRQGDKPWFMGLGFVRPHVPNVAPAKFFDMYPLEKITPFVNPPGDRDDIPKASELTINTRANDMGMNEADKREALRGYFASVSYMDSLVGRVLDHLERKRIADRTVVVFWGDHGWHLGEHHRWQKRSLMEESARVPLIVYDPGRRGGGKASKALVELVDLYPTLAETCGVTPPATIEGQSFVPLLDDPARAWKTAAFTQVSNRGDIVGRSVRTERYRYIRWDGPLPDEELYDHQTDPQEFTNLARKPGHERQITNLRAVLDAGWRVARARV